ncbi:STAS domain-containing protein [Streptomyces sp. NPDC059618]|uniref:STAS domain-containing protein n=1 Tax=Streptomyces sp. NPDC059618 TaxID=3346887 RepID=UPI00369419B8
MDLFVESVAVRSARSFPVMNGRLAVDVASRAGGATVSVHGEIDLAGVELLRRALLKAAAVCRTGDVVTLDLSDVTFCDGSGLDELLRARRRALCEHCSLTIVAASPAVRHLLELTGTAALLDSDSPRTGPARLSGVRP